MRFLVGSLVNEGNEEILFDFPNSVLKKKKTVSEFIFLSVH